MGLQEKFDFYPANWHTSRGGYGIVGIVTHATVGTDSRAYLKRGGERRDGSDRKVSAHTLIDKGGDCWRFVDDSRAANHAGFSTMTVGGRTYSPNGISVNYVTLGVELENRQDGRDPYTEPQLMTLGHLLNHWREKFGPLPILRHGDIDPTRRSDPQSLSVAAIELWCARAAGQQTEPSTGRMFRVVVPAGARVRAAPDTTSSTLAILSLGTMVETFGVLEGSAPQGQRDRRWVSVRLPDGRRGWVYAPLLGGGS